MDASWQRYAERYRWISQHSAKTIESGVRYVTAKHVKPGLIDFDSCLYVSPEDFEEIASKTRPRKGDVLVVNIGAGCGLASIIEVDFEFD